MRALLLEPEAVGGQAGSSSFIENYLGFPTGISGAELAKRAFIQATRFGTELLAQNAAGIRSQNHYHYLCLADGKELSCRIILVAVGVNYRRLDVEGLDQFTGAGVYYGAAMTEAISCRDEEVFIVGGANSAGQAAMYFAKYARKVTILVRGDSLIISMSKNLIDQIAATSNILLETNTQVIGASGGQEARVDSTFLLDRAEETEAASVCPLYLHRRGAKHELAAGIDHARPQWFRPHREGHFSRRSAAESMEGRPATVSS